MKQKFDADKRIQKSLNGRFLFVVGILFLVVYFFLGLAVMFWRKFPIEMPQNYRYIFGGLLIAYAMIRFGRLLKKSKIET
jgi:hypothetical protein